MDSIIIDTSSILFAFSNHVDIFKEAEAQLSLKPVISKGVIKELGRMAESRKAESKYAKAAIALIEKHNISIEKEEGYVDRWILTNANKIGSVCTNDMKLKVALKARGVPVYTVSRSGILR